MSPVSSECSVEQIERQVRLSLFLLLLVGLLSGAILRIEQNLAGGTDATAVEPVVAAMLATLYESFCRLRVPLQILLDKRMYLAKVWLGEKRTIEIVDVLGQLPDGYSFPAYLVEYL